MSATRLSNSSILVNTAHNTPYSNSISLGNKPIWLIPSGRPASGIPSFLILM